MQSDLCSATEAQTIGRHDYWPGTEPDSCRHALKGAYGKVEILPLPFLNEEQDLEEICADGKVGVIAGDDKALEVADRIAAGVEDLGHEAGDVFADRVFFRMQLNGSDAVAEIYERRSGIAFDDAVRFAKVRNGRDAGRLEHGYIFGTSRVEHLLAPIPVPGRGTGMNQLPGIRRDGGVNTDRVPHFERPQFPVEAGAHGAVDAGRIFGDLGQAVGSVGKQPAEELLLECRGLIFANIAGHEQAQPLGQRFGVFSQFQRGKFGAGGRAVGNGLPVEREPDFVAVRVFSFL